MFLSYQGSGDDVGRSMGGQGVCSLVGGRGWPPGVCRGRGRQKMTARCLLLGRKGSGGRLGQSRRRGFRVGFCLGGTYSGESSDDGSSWDERNRLTAVVIISAAAWGLAYSGFIRVLLQMLAIFYRDNPWSQVT